MRTYLHHVLGIAYASLLLASTSLPLAASTTPTTKAATATGTATNVPDGLPDGGAMYYSISDKFKKIFLEQLANHLLDPAKVTAWHVSKGRFRYKNLTQPKT